MVQSFFFIWFADNILYIQLSIMIFCLKYSIITSECSWKRSNGVDYRRTRSVGRRCWLSWLLIVLSYLCQNYERFYFYNKNFSLRKEYSIILFVFYSFWSTFLHGCSLLLINKTCCHFPSSWLLGNFVERFSFQILIKSRFFLCASRKHSTVDSYEFLQWKNFLSQHAIKNVVHLDFFPKANRCNLSFQEFTSLNLLTISLNLWKWL